MPLVSHKLSFELPDRIALGFLEATGLHAMNLGRVLCYQTAGFHTGFTLFAPDASVYVQMCRLPNGEDKLREDLTFQVKGKKLGEAAKGRHTQTQDLSGGQDACGVFGEPETDYPSVPGAGAGGVPTISGELSA
jgi:hypothetical protein